MRLIFNTVPVPKGRPRFRGRFAFTPPKTRQFETELQMMAKAIYNEPALTGALTVNVTFTMPTRDKKRWGKPHAMRPDLDNLVKSLDAFNGVLWLDDAQIATVIARKVWGESGLISLQVTPEPVLPQSGGK